MAFRPFADAAASDDPARIVLFGVPYDRTCSFRGGSRWAPHAIREAAYNLETYMMDHGRDILDVRFHDLGDLGDFGPAEDMVKAVSETSARIVKAGKIPVALGGEHSNAPPVGRGLPQGGGVIGLDAHLDFRDAYLDNKWSHACSQRRIGEHVGFDRTLYAGVRSFSAEEKEDRERLGLSFISAYEIHQRGIERAIDRALHAVGRERRPPPRRDGHQRGEPRLGPRADRPPRGPPRAGGDHRDRGEVRWRRRASSSGPRRSGTRRASPSWTATRSGRSGPGASRPRPCSRATTSPRSGSTSDSATRRPRTGASSTTSGSPCRGSQGASPGGAGGFDRPRSGGRSSGPGGHGSSSRPPAGAPRSPWTGRGSASFRGGAGGPASSCGATRARSSTPSGTGSPSIAPCAGGGGRRGRVPAARGGRARLAAPRGGGGGPGGGGRGRRPGGGGGVPPVPGSPG